MNETKDYFGDPAAEGMAAARLDEEREREASLERWLKDRMVRLSKKDRSILAAKIFDANRNWQVGDRVQPFKGIKTTTIVERDGDTVTLANGQTGHRSNLRSLK